MANLLKPKTPAPDPELAAQKASERASQARTAQQAISGEQDRISQLFGSQSLLSSASAPKTSMGSLGSDWLAMQRMN